MWHAASPEIAVEKKATLADIYIGATQQVPSSFHRTWR